MKDNNNIHDKTHSFKEMNKCQCHNCNLIDIPLNIDMNEICNNKDTKNVLNNVKDLVKDKYNCNINVDITNDDKEIHH